SQYNDAKTMFAAIETQFRGNEATKKTQKTLLKQQYENFSASSTESLDSIFNRLQKIKSVGASSGAQNLAFMTAPSTRSTNDVNTAKHAYEVSTVSPNVNTASPQVSTTSFSDNAVYAFMVENSNGSNLLQQDLEQIPEDDLEVMDLKWQLSLLSMRAKRYYKRTCKKIFINANDKSKVECFNYHKMGHFARECRASRNKEGQFRNQENTRKHGNNEDTSSKAMLAIDGVGFDWSDMAEEQVQTNMALMPFSDSKNEVLFSKEVVVLKREVACKDYEINVLKSDFEKVKQEKEGREKISIDNKSYVENTIVPFSLALDYKEGRKKRIDHLNKSKDVGFDELGEGGKEVVSKIREFGGDRGGEEDERGFIIIGEVGGVLFG
ncbi:putative ribonuclease H-like domain-containing protein, partial [Tanacetum coccineum]